MDFCMVSDKAGKLLYLFRFVINYILYNYLYIYRSNLSPEAFSPLEIIIFFLSPTLYNRLLFIQKMWRMSSSSSTMTIPAPLRITSTVLDVRPAVPTRALPTPSSPQGTCDRPETLSGCWQKPGRPSTLNCFSSWTLGVVEEEAVRTDIIVCHTVKYKRRDSLRL